MADAGESRVTVEPRTGGFRIRGAVWRAKTRRRNSARIFHARWPSSWLPTLVLSIPVLGGLDSAVVVVAAAGMRERLHTFSFGFEDHVSELPYAQEIAARYGTVHEELTARDVDIAHERRRWIRFTTSLSLIRPRYRPTYFVHGGETSEGDSPATAPMSERADTTGGTARWLLVMSGVGDGGYRRLLAGRA